MKTDEFLISNGYDKETINVVLNNFKNKEKQSWTYVVKKGDTLFSISKTFKVPLKELLEVNGLNEKTVIKPGDKILVPGIRPKLQIAQIPKLKGKYVTALSSIGDLIVPVSGFNWGQKHSHNGSDISAPCGTPVYSAYEGEVIESLDGWNGGYGNYVIIKHNGFYTLYGHLSLRIVEKGDYVNKGELIGYVGNTGYTIGQTGCHLHFEVRGKSNPFLQ